MQKARFLSQRPTTVALWILAILLSITTPSAYGLPSGFTVTEIESSKSTGAFPFYRGAAINSDGILCYKGASTTAAAIIRNDGVTRNLVASTQDGTGTFDQFPSSLCSINSAGDVAFDSCRNCKPLPPGVPPPPQPPAPILYSVYKRLYSAGASSPLQLIATTGAASSEFGLIALPSLSDTGAVFFSGALQSGVGGIWRKAPLSQGGALTTVSDTTSSYANLGGVFANASEQLTYGATLDSSPENRAIYGPAAQPVIGAFSGFSALSLPVINKSGDIAVLAVKATTSPGAVVPDNGLYLNGTPFITNTGEFQMVEISPFRSVSLNDNSQMVFAAARRDGTIGVYLAANGGLLTILQEGDILPGHSSPVFRAEVGRQAINHKMQIAMAVVLKDGTELVLRLEPTNVVLPGDQCPQDNAKFEAGVCGCGVSDADSNHDGILNCQVTPLANQLTQEIAGTLAKLKRLSPRAPTSAKKSQIQLQRQALAIGNKLYRLVRNSTPDIRLKNTRRSPIALANAIRTKLRAAVNTRDRRFSANRAAALSSLRQFSKSLLLQ